MARALGPAMLALQRGHQRAAPGPGWCVERSGGCVTELPGQCCMAGRARALGGLPGRAVSGQEMETPGAAAAPHLEPRLISLDLPRGGPLPRDREKDERRSPRTPGGFKLISHSPRLAFDVASRGPDCCGTPPFPLRGLRPGAAWRDPCPRRVQCIWGAIY